jgi:GT2 family glycosyltransferase
MSRKRKDDMHINLLLLTWDGLRYLPDLFKSIDAQTYRNFTLRICDNGSVDGTVDYLRMQRTRELVLCNNKNIGYAPGYNALYKFTLDHLVGDEEQIVVLLNQDIILAPDTLENIAHCFEKFPEIGSLQPKLLKAFADQSNDEIDEKTQSDILDSTGLAIRRDWRFYERGAGEMDRGQYDELNDIFGANGALACYRLKALVDASIDDNLFEEKFFAYREDCDLAWRLQKVGWKSRFEPSVRAHHYRGMYGAFKASLWERLRNRRGQRPFAAALSLRNEIYLYIRHLSMGDFVKYLPFIVFGFGGRFLYAVIVENVTRRELVKSLKFWGYMFDSRRKIREKTTININDLRKYVITD